MNGRRPSRDDPRTLWRRQPVTAPAPEPAVTASRAAGLERRLWRRNLLEYLAGGGAGIFLAHAGITTLSAADTPAEQVIGWGFCLIAASLAWILWRLRQRSRRLPADDDAPDGVTFILRRLRREHGLLRRAWLWYVGPLVPGFVLVYGGTLLETGLALLPLASAAGTVAVLVGIALLNRRAAAGLQAEIDALEAQRTGASDAAGG